MPRPSTYKPEYCDLIQEHFSHGKCLQSFLFKHRINRRTFYDWIRKYSELRFAYEMADMAAFIFWEQLLIAYATGTVHRLIPGACPTKNGAQVVMATLAQRWPHIYGPNAENDGTFCDNPRGIHLIPKTHEEHVETLHQGLAA